jgi:hypothetical protein
MLGLKRSRRADRVRAAGKTDTGAALLGEGQRACRRGIGELLSVSALMRHARVSTNRK